jgi:hypothetical protein
MSHMRSSQKNRNSRNKGGRNKSSGNVLNRVYESAGPEGKVRGTPQQVIDKYLLLARDAQTSGDRVMAENFLQHAEHYIRLLNAAMPQQNEERRQPYGNGGQPDLEQGDGQPDQPQQQGNGDASESMPPEAARADAGAQAAQSEAAEPSGQKPAGGTSSGLETIDVGDDSEADMVDTPENSAGAQQTAEEPKAEASESEAAEEPKPKPRRRTRRPRNADEVAAE